MADWDTIHVVTLDGLELTVEVERDSGHLLTNGEDPRVFMDGSGMVRVAGHPDLAMPFIAWHFGEDGVAFVSPRNEDDTNTVRTFAPPVTALFPARPSVWKCRQPDPEDLHG